MSMAQQYQTHNRHYDVDEGETFSRQRVLNSSQT